MSDKFMGFVREVRETGREVAKEVVASVEQPEAGKNERPIESSGFAKVFERQVKGFIGEFKEMAKELAWPAPQVYRAIRRRMSRSNTNEIGK